MKKFWKALLKFFICALLGVCVFGLGFSVIYGWPSGSGWNVAYVFLFAGSVGFSICCFVSFATDFVIKYFKRFYKKSPSDQEASE